MRGQRDPQDVRDAISNNVTALMAIAVVAFVIVMGIQVLATPASEKGPLQGGRGRAGILGAGVPRPWPGCTPSTVVPSCATATTRRRSCSSSAIVAVVFVSGRGLAHKQAKEDGRPVRAHFWNRYFWGFVLMVCLGFAGIAVTGPWLGWLDHWVFWLEAALIAQLGKGAFVG